MEKARIPLEVQATANYLNSDPSATTKDVRRYLNNEYPNIAHSYNMALARIKMAHENELITEERRDSTSIYYSKKAFERMEKAAELYRKGKSLGEISKTLPKIINREKSKNMARETARKIIKNAIEEGFMSELEYNCISRAKLGRMRKEGTLKE